MFRSPAYREPNEVVGTAAELFAGVGGFRVGLSRAGWKTVYSNQWEPSTKTQHASDVYVHNFGAEGHSNEDIFGVAAIPALFDMLVGGFPCQDYSVAKARGAALGLEGKKGVLWWEIARLVSTSRPKYLLLENVDRLLYSPTAQRGRDFAIMLATLGMLGYSVEWRLINAADYGFPQRRKRVWIFASRLGAHDQPAESLIFEDGILARSFPVEGNTVGISTVKIGERPDLVSQDGQIRGTQGFSNAGIFRDGIAYQSKVSAKFDGPRFTLGDVLVSPDLVPENFRIPDSDVPRWSEAKGSKKLLRVAKSTGFQYVYSEGAMSFPDKLENPSRTVLTAEGGTTPSRFKHAVFDGQGLRRLLPIELERLSDFPDNWTALAGPNNPVRDSRRAFLIGNALVTGLVTRIAKHLRT